MLPTMPESTGEAAQPQQPTQSQDGPSTDAGPSTVAGLPTDADPSTAASPSTAAVAPKNEEANVDLYSVPPVVEKEDNQVTDAANGDTKDMDEKRMFIDQNTNDNTNATAVGRMNSDTNATTDEKMHNNTNNTTDNRTSHNTNSTADNHIGDDSNCKTEERMSSNTNGVTDEPMSDDTHDPQVETFPNLERIRSSSVGSETVGECVKIGLNILDRLHALLTIEDNDGEEAARWLTRFAKLKKRLKEQRTVVGVLGNTGAGKSSLINALLDEESLIPTSSLRACTAVPTEVSFNHDDNPEHSYRGEVEFISVGEWQKEVGLLLTELVDPTKKLSKDYLQDDTGAGIAYAKIKAVYPNLSNAKLAKSSVQDLMDDPAVENVLGTVKSHKRSNAGELKVDLQAYVDSDGRHNHDTEAQTTMAYWPLVKVVRIYLKSRVLSTGTVLVDLPGVQDSNAARSAVADGFRQECSSVWVVSPIIRAVDDKAAKNLLGTSFKLQLTMDGNYSNVTFVCSKTDDISVAGVADKLDVDGTIRAIWDREEECSREILKLKREMRRQADEREELEERREELETQRPKKRKLAEVLNSDNAQGLQDPSTGVDAADGDPEAEIAHVGKEIVRIRKVLKEMKTRMSDLQAESRALKIEATAKCVEARNKYSKGAIRTDFADGVREMAEDTETQQPGNITQPAAEQDYAQIAQSLLVFCVSSRGYQYLMGRCLKDGDIGGYRCPADTEIPQLQEHGMRLGELELLTTNKEFLADLAGLLRSMLLWASSGCSSRNGQVQPLSDRDISKMSCLNSLLAALELELKSRIKSTISGISTRVKDELLEPISPMCMDASRKLPGIAFRWQEKKNAQGGPLQYPTFRSILLHGGEGVSRLAKGLNFNEDLFVPLKKQMAAHWGAMFSSTFNNGMAIFALSAIEALEDFHVKVLERPELDASNSTYIGLLNEQFDGRVQSIRQAEAKFKLKVLRHQHLCSRLFVKEIATYMKEIYGRCASLHGTGVFNRIKEALEEFVDENRQEILTKPLEEVGKLLVRVCSLYEGHMGTYAEDILLKIKEDYQLAILGREVVLSGTSDVSPTLRAMQEKVYDMLLKVDDEFAGVSPTANAA